MERKDDRNNCVKAAQKEKLRAARKLFEISEKGLGTEDAEDSGELLDNLSARQDAIDELMAADKTVRELVEKSEAEGCGQPEDPSLAAETDRVLLKIRDLYREDAEEAQNRMDQYQDKIIQLSARKKTLSAFPKDSEGIEGSRFEARG